MRADQQHAQALQTIPPARVEKLRQQIARKNARDEMGKRALDAPPDEVTASLRKVRRSEEFTRYVGPALIVVCIVTLAAMYPAFAIIIAVCACLLIPSIILHELGHLVAAKAMSMRVTEYSVGFGPVILKRDWHGIQWSIRMFPLGGFVEIAGMTVEDVEARGLDPGSAFIYQSARAKAFVVLAGIATNVLLAWVGLTCAVLLIIPPEHLNWDVLLMAPVQAVQLLWQVIAITGGTILHGLFNWADPGLGSVLSMPQAFATGATAAQDEGIPLFAYIAMAGGVINMSLAVLNVLPLYPLDGYHGAMAVVDGTRRFVHRHTPRRFAPLSMWQMRWFARGTGAFFGVFIGAVFFHDIVRLIQ